MAGKSTTPDDVTAALALREAGYTVLSISQRLGISTRTVERHLAAHGAKKGALSAALVERAREDLLKRVTSDRGIQEEAAKLVNDDLAHAHHLRAIVAHASDQLAATSLREAVLVMRAAAAYSTAIKNTSDMIRRSLRIDQVMAPPDSELPELVVRELTPTEVAALRDETAADAADEDSGAVPAGS